MSSYKERLEELKAIADHKPNGAIEELVLTLHAVNTANNLKCQVEESQYVLPQNWAAHQQGVYTFQYKLPSDKRAQFRFVDNGDGNLSVNFVLEGTETLNQMSLKIADAANSNAEKYDTYLKAVLTGKTGAQSTQPSRQPLNLQPVPIPLSRPTFEPTRPPLLIGPSSSSSNPFPGGGMFNPNGELVGPDSYMFRGANRPFGQGDDNPLRIPPGARYDPTSPFDTRGQGLNPDRNDFFGFDEFGQPRRGPTRGPGPNGFGGGLGGGFGGGFGGGNPRFF